MSSGGHAFEGCSGLTSVTIPTSVTTIGIIAIINIIFTIITIITIITIVSIISIIIINIIIVTIFSIIIIIHPTGEYAFNACPFTCIKNWNPTTARTLGTGALPSTTACGNIDPKSLYF